MEKILVIDDDSVVRVLLRQLFEQTGYTVCEASDGNEGVKLFKKESPDLVVTDLIMPEKEGLEAIKEIKSLKPDSKIVAISGGGIGNAQIYLGLARRLGASHVFEKPLNVSEVLSTVQTLLEA